MRDTKDIADAVFRIRDEHLEQQRKKCIRIKKACAAVSAVAAAGVITTGAVHFFASADKKPVQDTEVISVTEETTEITSAAVTAVNTDPAPVSTYMTAVTALSKKNGSTASSAVTVSATSRISSENNSNTASRTGTATAAAAAVQTTTTADISLSDCEEVIRMKVFNVKKYLAALSAAALTANAGQLPANAEDLYTPNALDPLADTIIYIEDNPELFDLDGNGKPDTFDVYALYTYLNEPSSLPEGYAERCKAKGDANKDGKVDSADLDLLSEMFIYKFSDEQYRTFYAERYNFISKKPDSCEHIERILPDDAPEDVKERLKNNEFLETGYSYGSDKNIYDFVDLCFDIYLNGIEWEETFKYNDAYYKRFADDAKSRNYSFDVNEDGVTDLKDLYDIFIYDSASADVFSNIQKNDCFMRYNTITTGEGITEQVNYNFDVKLRDRLTLSEAEKQKLWEKCEPIYDYVYSFIDYEKHGTILGDVRVFDMIGRYIMNDSDLNYLSTNSIYYMQYRDNVMLCDHSVATEFAEYMSMLLHRDFIRAGVDYSGQNESPKIYTAIEDYECMHDNDAFIALGKKSKAEYESGLTKELYDINKDGKVDKFDYFTFDLYMSELYRYITPENTILPAEQWNFIDTELDLDHDGIGGTFVDYIVYEYVTGSTIAEYDYELNIYYLELVEKKGFTDLSDIRPYIEQLCKNKESGDVDLDGNVTAVDASEVLGYYSQVSVDEEVSTVTEARMQYMADLNNDGFVDSVDACAILRQYAVNSVTG